MIFFHLPVELLLHTGSYLPRQDLISLATTCKAIRTVFMIQLFGGTVQIRSPFPLFPGVLDVFNFLEQRMPGLENCIDQVTFYRTHSDLASSVHTVRITNWVAPSPRGFWLAASKPEHVGLQCQALLQAFGSKQYYSNALTVLSGIYNYIVVDLVQFLPFSELQLIRTHITANMHYTLNMPRLKRLTLEDCVFAELNFHNDADTGHRSQYESFQVTSRKGSYLLWDALYSKKIYIQVYLFECCSALTKLEICIEFLYDDALDRLSLPSLTSLAIVPHGDTACEMWSWGTVYRILKISPNITYFRFEPVQPASIFLYPFEETTDWREYKGRITHLPLSQLSSITAYRQLVKRLVPGRPVNFVKILLFPEEWTRNVNFSDPESDDEAMHHQHGTYIVPYQLLRSATPIKTLYLERIAEQDEGDVALLARLDLSLMRDACPSVTDLWLPPLGIYRRRKFEFNCRDPADIAEFLEMLNVWDGMTLERCAVGPRSPWIAKELQWHREDTILPERVHPMLKELLLDIVLWKWHDDSEVTGWVLYTTTDIEEDKGLAIYSNGFDIWPSDV